MAYFNEFFLNTYRKIRNGYFKILTRLTTIRLRKYKDKFKGKRCFIIGNGPSLKVDDLENISDEITFASHGIYYIYDKTSWRPTFYCAQDAKLINQRYKEIKHLCKDSKRFFGIIFGWKYPIFSPKSFLIRLVDEKRDGTKPSFSDKPNDCFFEGMTVTYFNIQLAAFMGFNEIYLLGVDHFYSGGENDHFSPKDICTNIPRLDKSTLAYISAKEYAEKHNIKIYNATRGGHLEIFERKDFETIISNDFGG